MVAPDSTTHAAGLERVIDSLVSLGLLRCGDGKGMDGLDGHCYYVSTFCYLYFHLFLFQFFSNRKLKIKNRVTPYFLFLFSILPMAQHCLFIFARKPTFAQS
jgi:hypothetical protein